MHHTSVTAQAFLITCTILRNRGSYRWQQTMAIIPVPEVKNRLCNQSCHPFPSNNQTFIGMLAVFR
jgi:hypothetical protein